MDGGVARRRPASHAAPKWDNSPVKETDPQQVPLILASTSAYRRALLERLQLRYIAIAPHVDESALAGESSTDLARRLALAKAHAVAQSHPQAIVIGSDQVADLQGQRLGKPGSVERAREQLRAMSGRTVVFHTAVAVVRADTQFERVVDIPVTVLMRQLSQQEIEAYLRKEPALDCAGSAKSEGLGIALMQSLASSDPTALVGLPLIATAQLLREAGLDPLLA